MDSNLEQYRSVVQELAKEGPTLTREEFDKRFLNITEEKFKIFKNVLDHLWELYCELKKIF